MANIHSRTGPDAGRTAPPRAHQAFEALRTERVESLNLVVEEYRHRATGALHYHLAADNPENVFLVALRTVPTDSTGVAHILEHTALCGSEHYPVRDPFFLMIRRSLNTFMNAFTSSDWTAYPFASQNRKDFWNLLDVYLDAVFFSRLDPLDFAQEGHRVEFADPANPDSPLVYKGVVYNEMKGSMSSPVNTLWRRLAAHLFPTTTYHYNSGGDPEHIPDLTYEQLREFYRTHYHPSNAVFMTYGDIPAAEHQQRFEERALGRYERLDAHISVDNERRLEQPVSVEEPYALDEQDADGDRAHIVLAWLLGPNTDTRELLEAHLLSSVLLDNGASPLRRALEQTDLGAAPSPLCGLEDSNHEMSFMCGLEGSRAEHAAALEKLVLSVLRDVADNGIEQDKVEAALHQLELSQREVGGDSYPYGLSLILTALPAAIHHGDPVALLNIDPVLGSLRQAIADPQFIPGLVRRWLLDNPHRVRLALRPDPGLSAQREAQEQARLAAQADAMTPADRQAVIEQAARLAQRQDQVDDPEILPKVELSDVPPDLRIPTGHTVDIAGCPAEYFSQGTNGLVYSDVVVDMPRLAPEQIAVLPGYVECVTELGVGARSYLETQAWQDAVSGGIDASTTTRGTTDDVQKIKACFSLSGKALERNVAELAELMHETFSAVRFDEVDRIRDVIAQQRARAEQSITGNGHGLAMLAASSGLAPAARLANRLRGLEGIAALKRLDDSLEDAGTLAELAARMAGIHAAIVAAPRRFLLVGEAPLEGDLTSAFQRHFTNGVAAQGFEGFGLDPVDETLREMWVTSTQVNFCARAYPAVPPSHPDAAPLTVLGGFLRNGYLHKAIREQGGAYGGGAGYEPDYAAFRFFSYRDPRLDETLADFDRAIDWLLGSGHAWRQVEEAILGVIGAIDKPGSPAGEARRAYYSALFGRTPAYRRQLRERVLAVGLSDLQRVGERYLVPQRASTAVITNAAALSQRGDLGLAVRRL